MYLIISMLVLFVSWWLFRQAAGSMNWRQVNMVNWIFYFDLLIQSFLGSLLLLYRFGAIYGQDKLMSVTPIYYAWLSVNYVMLALPLAMVLLQKLLGFQMRDLWYDYIHKPVMQSAALTEQGVRVYLYILTIIGLLSVWYIFVLNGFPLAGVFGGDSAKSLAVMRIDISRHFSGLIYIRNIMALTIVPILAYASFIFWRDSRRRFDFWWFAVLFVHACLALTYNLAKAPILYFLVGMMALWVLYKGALHRGVFVLFFLLMLLLTVVLYLFIAQVKDFHVLFGLESGMVGRILFSQLAGLVFSFQIFPDFHAWVGWASISELWSHVLHVPYQDRVARIVMSAVNPSGVREGISGVMNSLFVEEAWGNFGLLGLLLSPWYVGILIGGFFLFLLKANKTPVLMAVFAYYSTHSSITGGFNDYLYNPSMWVVFVVFALPYICARVLFQPGQAQLP